jgi:signal recognition particle subunit SRP54
MFQGLTSKLQKLAALLPSRKYLTEDNIAAAVREVRLALLEADVQYQVASRFVKRVKERILGGALLKGVRPGEQFIELIHEELVSLMGSQESVLSLQGPLSSIMVCGLQGAGKTTTVAKLGRYIVKHFPRKKILTVACDLQRPGAVQQLRVLSEKAGLDLFSLDHERDPLVVAEKAFSYAKERGYQVVLFDTAGRLHLDEDLMEELAILKKKVTPQEVLFVANATLGQDAVNTVLEFDRKVGITGSILTMLDGDARAGCALSIFDVTGKPLKFEGVGEAIEDLQLFHPKSMADRILGMGDVVNLVKKAKEHFDEEQSLEMKEKLLTASFTYTDYLKQMGRLKKMGSLSGLLKMIPQVGSLFDTDVSDGQFRQMEALIYSMTPDERSEKVELCIARKKRIAKGSGVPFDQVGRLVNNFKQAKKLFKDMPSMKKKLKGMEIFPK